jgi:myo-inositol-1(or 4)-monophosphatase
MERTQTSAFRKQMERTNRPLRSATSAFRDLLGEKMLQTAIQAARRAGELIVERYPAGRDVAFKGYRDIVTDTDKAAQTVILDLIRARFPAHAVLSEEEEGGEIGGGYTWVVDPLDGTTNYAHRVPVFAVSIGVLEGGEPLIGVIHDPLRGQTFVAQRGSGATLNDAPIRVSRVSILKHALLSLDWGHSNAVREQVMTYLRRMLLCCGTVRALGSATLALAYVAAGWLDGYFNLRMKPWDAAAGILLIAEAGGRCTTSGGGPYRVDVPDCLVTNGLLHDEVLAVMQAT